jgi:hypothetical protein
VTARRTDFQLALACGDPVRPSIEPLPSIASCSIPAGLALAQRLVCAGVGAGLPVTQSGSRGGGGQPVSRSATPTTDNPRGMGLLRTIGLSLAQFLLLTLPELLLLVHPQNGGSQRADVVPGRSWRAIRQRSESPGRQLVHGAACKAQVQSTWISQA